jgi:hypothetical protein
MVVATNTFRSENMTNTHRLLLVERARGEGSPGRAGQGHPNIDRSRHRSRSSEGCFGSGVLSMSTDWSLLEPYERAGVARASLSVPPDLKEIRVRRGYLCRDG